LRALPPLPLSSSSIQSPRHRELWARQVPRLSRSFRVITYDARGHGFSQVTAGDYTIEQLGATHSRSSTMPVSSQHTVCGISLGGITAMWLGVHAPRRITSLVLANTAARIGSLEMWTERIAFVKQQGMATLADLTMPRWFTDGFRAREPQTIRAVQNDGGGVPEGRLFELLRGAAG
jgi:3-oxoadipate enol-lactonase